MTTSLLDDKSDSSYFIALPCELKVHVLLASDVFTLSKVSRTCQELGPIVEQVLRVRAQRAGRAFFDGGLQMMLWRERRDLQKDAAGLIAAGAQHSAIVSEGDCYSFGIDEHARGFLGHAVGEAIARESYLLPSLVPIGRDGDWLSRSRPEWEVVAVATHSLHTLVLTRHGLVFSFGFGHCGQLGHGDTATLWRPRLVEALARAGERAVAISVGQQHSLVLTDAGVSLSFGSGFSGKLGLGDQRNHATPQAIRDALWDLPVSVLVAGSMHSMAADEHGRVFTFGCNAECQLGHGGRDDEHKPRVVEGLRAQRIVRLAGGEHHSLAVSDAGQVFSWGAGEARARTSAFSGGWLGHRTVESHPLPRRVEALAGVRVVAIAASRQHSLALADGGAVFSFGDGGGGKLGHDDGGRMHWVPTRIRALDGCRVAAIAAGEAHSLCVLDDGRVLSWGCGSALGLHASALTENGAEVPMSWSSAGNYEWAPGDEERRWQAHVPSQLQIRTGGGGGGDRGGDGGALAGGEHPGMS